MKSFQGTSPKPESTEGEVLLVVGRGQSEEQSTGHCWPCLGASRRWKSKQVMEQDIPKEAKKPLEVQQPLIISVLNHLQCEVRLSQQLSRGVSRGLPCTSGCTNYPEPFLSCSTLRGLCAWLAGGSSTSQRPNDRRREEKLQEKERERLGFCLFASTQKLTFQRAIW